MAAVAFVFDSPQQVVRVPRSIRPPYKNWVKEVMDPDLEKLGPEEYDPTSLTSWLYPERELKPVKWGVIYGYLKITYMLPTCIGLADLLAIQALGVDYFRQHWTGKSIYGTKSAVIRRLGNTEQLPFLCAHGSKVMLGWRSFQNYWGKDDLILTF